MRLSFWRLLYARTNQPFAVAIPGLCVPFQRHLAFIFYSCVHIYPYICVRVCIYNIGIYIMYVLPIYLNLCAVYLYIYVCIFNNIYECADGVSVCILSL